MWKLFKVSLLLVLGGLGVAAMAACDARTSGVKLTIQAEAVGVLSNGKSIATFTNRRGWKIELEQAYMLIGPMYLLEGEPQASLWDYLRPWSIAHAHVNANGQKVLAELREHFVLDLLKLSPTSLGAIKGIEGNAQTAELHLLPPGRTRLSKHSASITNVSNATVHAKGKASKGQEVRPFQLTLTLPKTDNKQLVQNIGTEIDLQEDNIEQGRLQLRIYVDRWFTNVDFMSLNKKDKNGRFMLTAEDNAIVQGIRSRYSYNFSWRSK